jgi:hypothetical protein
MFKAMLVLCFSTIIDKSFERFKYFSAVSENHKKKKMELNTLKKKKEIKRRNTLMIK